MTAISRGSRSTRARTRTCSRECVFNPAWEGGLAGSVQTAAATLAGDAGPVLIAGCDQPALSQAHLRALLDGAESAPARCAATLHDAVPGIPVVVPGALLSQARTLDGDHGLGALLRALPREAIFTLDAPELRVDLDTEDDVRAAIARRWLDAASTD